MWWLDAYPLAARPAGIGQIAAEITVSKVAMLGNLGVGDAMLGEYVATLFGNLIEAGASINGDVAHWVDRI